MARNPLNNYLSLIDIRNHHKEDNMNSAKFIERSQTVQKLIKSLGFEDVNDDNKVDKDTFISNWATIVQDKAFTSNRIKELFKMAKGKRIHEDMTTKQIMIYVNPLLKPYEIVVRSYRGNSYKLEHMYGFAGLIRPENKAGKYYMDEHGLLNQVKKAN